MQDICETPHRPVLCQWDQDWSSQPVTGKFTLWLPPPTVARQLIYHLLVRWAESPWGTALAFVIPRVMVKDWGHLSKHVQRMGNSGRFLWTELPWATDTRYPLSIPIVLLYVAPHLPTLPPPSRTDSPPFSSTGKWHREQADAMRGMSRGHGGE